MSRTSLEHIISGADPTPGIVAVESTLDQVTMYRRAGDTVICEQAELQPWLIAERPVDLPEAEWTPLAGEGYSHLAEFPRWPDFTEARQRLTDSGANHFTYNSPSRQYLVRSGSTLFKGLAFEDLHRLQLDIETIGLAPEAEDARIILAALSDSRGWSAALEGEEPDILAEVSQAIRDRDPDVIEGHNIFGFDLPFLASRARAHGVPLDWGRDGSVLRFGRRRRCAIGGRSRPFVPAYVWGRHIIDTMFGVQRYDAQSGELESYGLKEVTRQLGLGEADRVLIDHADIPAEWRRDPDRVRRYAAHDVAETGRLASHVMPTDFYVTQMVPDTFQNVAVSGTGEKINSLFVREYLRQGVALPRPQSPRSFPGGYVEVRRVGVISPIVKVDVESLYPSIMLADGIAPDTDSLGIFLPMLRELTARRLEAKARTAAAEGPERVRWNGIQSSFKVLINSFYGYLGSGFLFNDYEAAERVTRRGQTLIREIADRIEAADGQVVEIDTDGIYFRPPESVRGEAAEQAYVEDIGAVLPKEIRLLHDGRYRAMVSLKAKNYVCVSYDGRKVFHGAAVRSRADEPFGREFLAAAMDLLLAEDLEGLSAQYRDMLGRIEAGELPIAQLARRERVTEKTFTSPAKRRSALAARGVAVGDYMTVYQRADGSLGRVEDYAGDEDRAYYAEKLYRFALRLKEVIGSQFDEVFPRPSAESVRQASAGQRGLDLH
jgi:DNA polymerase I